ncbi:MAG TPA: SLC13 family permease, partial [Pseudomonadales bacterium]|nr:SLC13 family permease [Pseudomonadales bacterium]
MDWQGWFTVALTVAVLATLITVPRLGTDVVLMGALLLLGGTGILTPDEALAGFANTGLITVAAMFIIAAGIRASGGVDLVVEKILGKPTGPRQALVRLMVPVVGLSAFLNNTPVVATMIPAVSQWARRIRVPSSTLMIPLSYASILGGTITLIGTSTNLVVNGQYQALTGKPGFALFDIAPLGLIVAAAGTLFVVIVAPKLLRIRRSPDQTFADTRKFTFEVAVAQDGPMVGKTIQQASLRNLERIYLAEIERDGGVITAVAPEEILRGGDRLVFVGETEAIVDILRINGLVPAVGSKPALERHVPERRLVEAVVAEHCEVVGQTIRDGRFRDLYGAVVLAVARNGEHIRGRLSSIILEPGDLLLLEARPAVVSRLKHSRDFLLMSVLEHELPDHSHAWISWGILVAIVALATSGVLSMLYAGLFGVAAMLATGCISTTEARRSLDLPVLVTIAASFALGNALEKTGAASFLGNGIVSLAGGNPWLLLALVYLSVMMLTEMITNNAAAML